MVRSHVIIRRSENAIFALLTNIAGYHQWLPGSNMSVVGTEYAAMGVDVGPGTLYSDRFLGAVMHGEIVGWQPPAQLRLRQSAQVRRWGLSGRVTVEIHYVLKQDGLQTNVTRAVTIQTTGMLFLLKLELIPAIQRENERTLQMMKIYLEARV